MAQKTVSSHGHQEADAQSLCMRLAQKQQPRLPGTGGAAFEKQQMDQAVEA